MYPFEEIKENLLERKAQIEIGEDGLAGRVDWYDGRIFVFIFSWGAGWEHLSVSTKDRCPTWEEMSYFKDIFWKPEECCVQYFPRESQYVNNCPTCLHIWRPIGRNIPEPPTILLGIV